MVKVIRCMHKFMTDREMRFRYINKLGLYRGLTDSAWIRRWYYAKTGEMIDLENPKNLNEKLQWYKIYYRRPIMTALVDKVKVRDYVREKGYGHLLSRQYGVYNRFEAIDFSTLPDVFYLKTNHGSGTNRLVHKSDLSDPKYMRRLKRYFNSALKKNYYLNFREWAYKDVEPKLICEEYLEPNDHMPLIDFNFFCFFGSVKFVLYNEGLAAKDGRHADAKRAVYDSHMNYIKGARTQMEVIPEEQCRIPEHMDEIMKAAEALAADFPLVRVDFMYVNKRAYFGEMTFYSGAGYLALEPPELLETFSEYFDIDRIRREDPTG